MRLITKSGMYDIPYDIVMLVIKHDRANTYRIMAQSIDEKFSPMLLGDGYELEEAKQILRKVSESAGAGYVSYKF